MWLQRRADTTASEWAGVVCPGSRPRRRDVARRRPDSGSSRSSAVDGQPGAPRPARDLASPATDREDVAPCRADVGQKADGLADRELVRLHAADCACPAVCHSVACCVYARPRSTTFAELLPRVHALQCQQKSRSTRRCSPPRSIACSATRAWRRLAVERETARSATRIVTFGYDLEFGGRDAFLTSCGSTRGPRSGRAAPRWPCSTPSCLTARGTRSAPRVRPDNPPRSGFYQRSGFVASPRIVMTRGCSGRRARPSP